MSFHSQQTITSICKAVLLKALPKDNDSKTNIYPNKIGNYWGLNFDDDRILPPEVDTCATCYCVSMLAESRSLELVGLGEDILKERDQKLVLGIKTILNVRNDDGFWPATVRMDKKIENDSENYSASVGDSYFALTALMASGFLDKEWEVIKLAEKYNIDLGVNIYGISDRVDFMRKTVNWLEKIAIRSKMGSIKGLPFNVVVKDGKLQRSGEYSDRNNPATTATINLLLVFISVIKALDKLNCLEIENVKALSKELRDFYAALIENIIRPNSNIEAYGPNCSELNSTLIATARFLELLVADAQFANNDHSVTIGRVYNTIVKQFLIKNTEKQNKIDFSSTIIANPSLYIETYKISYMSENSWYEEKILHENFIEGILANIFISLYRYCKDKNLDVDGNRQYTLKDYIQMFINNILERCHNLVIGDETVLVCMGYVPRSSGFYPVYTSYLAYNALHEASDILGSEVNNSTLSKLDKILLIKNNRDYFDSLKRDIHNVVPFIGAGLSVSMGYPLWDSALSKLRKRCNFNESEDKIVIDLIADGKYFDAAEKIKKTMKESAFYEAIRNCFDDRILQDKDWSSSPMSQVPKMFDNRLIITTNFDRVIQTAFVKYGKHINVLTPIQLTQTDQRLIGAVAEQRSILFKMHGDYEEERGIIFDTSSYDKYYGVSGTREKTPLVTQLTEVLKSKHLLFLGASLKMDRTMDVIRNVEESTEDSLWHYAIIECDIANTNLMNERDKELSELRIHPIFFPVGQYEYINIILEALADGN